jgi:chromosome segregation ATPase
MDEAGRRMEAAIDTVLARAGEALEQTRAGVVAQGDAMMRLIKQAKASLDDAAVESSAAFQERITAMGGEMDHLAVRIGEQAEASRTLLAGVADSVAAIEARLEKLQTDAPTKMASITRSLEALAAEAQRIASAIATGETSAAGLLGSVDTLRDRLTASLEQLNGALPRALNTLESQAEHSRRASADAAPEVERLAAAVTETASQVVRLEEQLSSIASSVDAATQKARELGGELSEARSSANALGEAATGALVEALTRVRETATQASLRAKEALAEVIPASAAMLAGETRAAFDQVMGEHVEVQLQRVGALSEQALATASKASDRLGRQLARMDETTQSIDARVDEANAAIDAVDRESFSRRSALLIEMLNGNAIEIARALDADVGDDAWQAYVGGDRGTFTRRAVRLLETAEARKVGKLYESDGAFKEQANRYVRDFEAMLRPILLNRDGGALSVTLLSSDMGKLYVALAQAMERLRS